MGRNTWFSIPIKHRPLKNRINLVVSKLGVSSLDQALLICPKDKRIFVIGGSMLYQEAIKHKDLRYIYVSKLNKEYECDVYFPKIDIPKVHQSEDINDFTINVYTTMQFDNTKLIVLLTIFKYLKSFELSGAIVDYVN